MGLYIGYQKILIAIKVCGFVSCHECGKRIVNSVSSLNSQEQRAVLRVEKKWLFLSVGDPCTHGENIKARLLFFNP